MKNNRVDWLVCIIFVCLHVENALFSHFDSIFRQVDLFIEIDKAINMTKL